MSMTSLENNIYNDKKTRYFNEIVAIAQPFSRQQMTTKREGFIKIENM